MNSQVEKDINNLLNDALNDLLSNASYNKQQKDFLINGIKIIKSEAIKQDIDAPCVLMDALAMLKAFIETPLAINNLKASDFRNHVKTRMKQVNKQLENILSQLKQAYQANTEIETVNDPRLEKASDYMMIKIVSSLPLEAMDDMVFDSIVKRTIEIMDIYNKYSKGLTDEQLDNGIDNMAKAHYDRIVRYLSRSNLDYLIENFEAMPNHMKLFTIISNVDPIKMQYQHGVLKIDGITEDDREKIMDALSLVLSSNVGIRERKHPFADDDENRPATEIISKYLETSTELSSANDESATEEELIDVLAEHISSAVDDSPEGKPGLYSKTKEAIATMASIVGFSEVLSSNCLHDLMSACDGYNEKLIEAEDNIIKEFNKYAKKNSIEKETREKAIELLKFFNHASDCMLDLEKEHLILVFDELYDFIDYNREEIDKAELTLAMMPIIQSISKLLQEEEESKERQNINVARYVAMNAETLLPLPAMLQKARSQMSKNENKKIIDEITKKAIK